jgi:hypothetical protein
MRPFQGKIIYDGFVSGYNITFGGGIKGMLNDTNKRAKAEFGIITSFEDHAAPKGERPRKPKKRPRKGMSAVGGRSASTYSPDKRGLSLSQPWIG